MTAWTDVIGWTLLHFVWEGTLIAGVTALALTVLRRASAQLRYIVVCGGLSMSIATAALTPLVLMGLEDQSSLAASRSGGLPGRILASADQLTLTRYASATQCRPSGRFS